jgi:hypothetical protein
MHLEDFSEQEGEHGDFGQPQWVLGDCIAQHGCLRQRLKQLGSDCFGVHKTVGFEKLIGGDLGKSVKSGWDGSATDARVVLHGIHSWTCFAVLCLDLMLLKSSQDSRTSGGGPISATSERQTNRIDSILEEVDNDRAEQTRTY